MESSTSSIPLQISADGIVTTRESSQIPTQPNLQTFIQNVAALKNTPIGRVVPTTVSDSTGNTVRAIVPHHLEEDEVIQDDVAKEEAIETVATEISEVINSVEEEEEQKRVLKRSGEEIARDSPKIYQKRVKLQRFFLGYVDEDGQDYQPPYFPPQDGNGNQFQFQQQFADGQYQHAIMIGEDGQQILTEEGGTRIIVGKQRQLHRDARRSFANRGRSTSDYDERVDERLDRK
ncbi:unnamed protein product [Oikopleura dioica]|uniref:Uncharacterized protein n=1 Tax=Oikopleura dioica TaxID=34765 RepID=E4XMW8_OIKDI|nr:unnamed protein product [Oikopleura dioica]